MQTQDGPAEILFKLWPKLEQNRKYIIGGAVVIAVAVVGFYVVSTQKAQSEVEAGEAVTSVLMSPAANGSPSQMATSLQAVAAKYSGTAAAERAQLQSAAALYGAGNYPEAQAQFQKYLDSNPNGNFAATAQLGIAACLEAQNKVDQAAAAYQRVVSVYPMSSSIGMAEYALGRICEQQNKFQEAMTHYQNVIMKTLNGSLSNEARERAFELQSKIAASAPKPAMSTNKPVMTLQPGAKQ